MGGYFFTLWTRVVFFDPFYAFLGYISQSGVDSMVGFVSLVFGSLFWIGALGLLLAIILFLTAGGSDGRLAVAGRTFAFSFLLLLISVGGIWLARFLAGYLFGP